MKNLKKRLISILKISCKLLLFLFLSFKVYSSDILLEIRGNDFTDEDVIISLIKEKPSKLDEEYSNYLINFEINQLRLPYLGEKFAINQINFDIAIHRFLKLMSYFLQSFW